MFVVSVHLSCTEDDNMAMPMEESHAIRFGIVSDDDDEVTHRAVSHENKLVNELILRTNASEDSLIANVYIADNIQTDQLISTRGSVVTEHNLKTFGVYASKSDGVDTKSYFSNLKVTHDPISGSCSSDHAYYWPGGIYTLGFMAISPYNPQGLSVNMDVDNAMPATLDYTVPSAPVDQSDLMLAVTPDYAGDYHQTVPLTFKHLCSAVNVKVGTIPQGSIEAITFKNISNKGTYTLASNTWSVTQGSKADFAVDFVGTSTNYPTAGTETGNPQINDASATFMMIPQTLPDDAEIEITFLHSNTGKEETLKASLKGTSWVMGQTNNYLISITPDYILDFAVEEIPLQDAHYVMVPLSIKANYLSEGWTLSAKNNTDSKITFRSEQTTLQKNGYWIEEDRGDTLITVSTLGDAVPIYAYLEENIGTSARDIELVLRPKGEIFKDESARTLKFSQLCPIWDNTFGSERIDDGSYPWGFLWDSNTKVTYSFESGNFWGWLYLIYINWRVGQLNKSYVTKTTSWGSLKTVTIDYSKVTAANVAESPDDGYSNTKELYNFNGVSDVVDFMNQLEAWGGESDKTLPINPSEFAARACVMKNKFNKKVQSSGGVSSDEAVLKDENFVWYLPASNEIIQIADTDYPMNGTYWTSTSAPSGETQAYKYTMGGNLSLDDRSKSFKVRAVRKKP